MPAGLWPVNIFWLKPMIMVSRLFPTYLFRGSDLNFLESIKHITSGIQNEERKTNMSRLWELIEFLRTRQRKNFSSRTRFTCPRAPFLVSRSRGLYVGSRSHYNDGEEGGLVELVLVCEITIPITFDTHHIECTSH